MRFAGLIAVETSSEQRSDYLLSGSLAAKGIYTLLSI
jgi:hypothetical protein